MNSKRRGQSFFTKQYWWHGYEQWSFKNWNCGCLENIQTLNLGLVGSQFPSAQWPTLEDGARPGQLPGVKVGTRANVKWHTVEKNSVERSMKLQRGSKRPMNPKQVLIVKC